MQVNVVVFSDTKQITLSEDATIADALYAAGLSRDSTVRYKGESVPPNIYGDIFVGEGDTILAAPPQVDHGRS